VRFGGYGEADELRMAEADMLAGHPEELAEISFDMMGLDLD
jgi:phosphoglycolate phosphatase